MTDKTGPELVEMLDGVETLQGVFSRLKEYDFHQHDVPNTLRRYISYDVLASHREFLILQRECKPENEKHWGVVRPYGSPIEYSFDEQKD